MRSERDAVGSRPLLETLDKAFLAAVREEVLQSLDLGPLLSRDRDRLVPPREDLLLPAVEAARLPGQLGEEAVHETASCLGVVHLQQEVQVVGEAGETEDPDSVEPLGAAEGSEEDLRS